MNWNASAAGWPLADFMHRMILPDPQLGPRETVSRAYLPEQATDMPVPDRDLPAPGQEHQASAADLPLPHCLYSEGLLAARERAGWVAKNRLLAFCMNLADL